MKLQIKSETIVEVTLIPPLFWKDKNGYEMRAFFSETDYREIFKCGDYTQILQRDPVHRTDAIGHAYTSWEPITELEFITKMDEVLESLSLTPKLTTHE